MLFRPQGLLGMKELSFVALCRRFAAFVRCKLGKKEAAP
jgi:branched-chain amino acid transport system permease protein